MKRNYRIFGKISLLFYLLCLYQICYLSQYGGIRSHLVLLLVDLLGFLTSFIFWLLFRRKKTEDVSGDSMKKKIFWIEMMVAVIGTLYFSGRIVYSAIPYNGALSWKLDELMNQKKLSFSHNNLFKDGPEGVLTDLGEVFDLPKELYIANSFEMTFDGTGTIQTLDSFIYGKDENGEKQTYLISYDAKQNEKMTVWADGGVNASYDNDMRLEPMFRILQGADYEQSPVRYIMEPEYISQKTLDEEQAAQMAEESKDAGTWTVDRTDETMYFFLDNSRGWRLVVTGAAAGSRSYKLEKTRDGGVHGKQETRIHLRERWALRKD